MWNMDVEMIKNEILDVLNNVIGNDSLISGAADYGNSCELTLICKNGSEFNLCICENET